MPWFRKYFLNEHLLMDKAGGGENGGGGGGEGEKPPGEKSAEKPPGESSSITLSKEQYDGLMARLAKVEGKPPGDDPDLLERARRDRELKDKNNNNSKALEDALRFDMSSKDWLKTNASLLPKDIGDIFETAGRETYDSAIEKDAAIKSGIIQSFFAQQSNMDLLTSGLKSKLEDYLKLTKTGKQDKAQEIYSGVFEPAFEMLKRVKKVEALSGGNGNQSEADQAYKQKLMGLSKKHYLGEKAQ